MSERPSVTPIRIRNSELEQILEEMERATGSDTGASKRAMRRWSMKGVKAVLTLTDSMGQQKHQMAVPRNLSTTGIGCVTGSFTHVGTRCVVSLRDRRGSVRSIAGKVMRCKHVRGSLHDVGVNFDAPVRPEDFREFNDEYQFHRENVQLDQLRGVILVIEDSIMDQKLLAAYFKNSPLELTFTRDAASGMSVLSEAPDMVIVDYHLPDMRGTELVKNIRASGYVRPVILLSTDDSPAVRREAEEAGASEVLIKPVTAGLIHQAAAEYLMGGSGRGTIRAERDPAVVTNEMVDEFVRELHRLAHELAALVRENAVEEVRVRANQIRGSASGYGFGGISDLASAAIKSLDATASLEESSAQLRELISACQRAVPTIAEPEVPERAA